MKKLLPLILILLISSPLFAVDFDIDYRLRRLEDDVRTLKYDLRNEIRERESLERRVQYLEMKLTEFGIDIK